MTSIKTDPERLAKWKAGGRALNATRRKWLADYKLSHGCQDCGYKECAAALQLDHEGPKTAAISDCRSSVRRLLQEIESGCCVVRCANCHSVRTWREKMKAVKVRTSRPISFYLASKFDRRNELFVVAEQLRKSGFIVKAMWLSGAHDGSPTDEIANQWAEQDLDDIQRCSHFAMFNLPVDDPEPSGGRHIELGYALALHKVCYVIGGDNSNIFYSMAMHVKTIEDFFEVLGRPAMDQEATKWMKWNSTQK